MDAFEAIMTRRSTRKYLPYPPEREKLEKILQAGRYAPSGSNAQTNHFFAVTDAKIIDRLASLVLQAFAKMEISEGMNKSLRYSVTQSKKGKYRFCYNAPVLVIIANRRDCGNNFADAAVACENMMIAANACDLGSCYINQLRWLNEDPELVKYMLSLGMAEDERVYASLILGYPDTESGLPERTPLGRNGNEISYITDGEDIK